MSPHSSLGDRPRSAPPAVIDGGAAPKPAVRSLAACLVRAAREAGRRGIHHVGEDGTASGQTYGELLDKASRVLGRLRAAGLAPGAKVLVQSSDEADLVVAFWACVLGGYVPVPVSAAPPAGCAKTPGQLLADGLRIVPGAPVLTSGVAPDDVTGAAWLADIGSLSTGDLDTRWSGSEGDDLAVLLLTSGSTGRQKAVALTHRNILSRCAAAVQVRRLTAGSRSFNWMPLDHVGGLVMIHIRDTYLTCDQWHAKTAWVLADPLRWIDIADRHRITTTWAPNFAYGLVNDQARRISGRAWDLSRLGYVMNGGEPVKRRVIRRFLELLSPFGLPSDAIHPGWGMSETSSGVVDCQYQPERPSAGRFIAVGTPHPGVAVRVMDDHGQIVPVGVIGHVQVSGAPVTAGYYENPEQNRRSFTEDGWFRTGDLGFVRDGALTVTGRADEVLSIGGTHVHADEIEAAVEELGFVEPSFTVCCPVPDGQEPSGQLAIFCHLRDGTEPAVASNAISEVIAERFGFSGVRILPVPRHRIPKTGIGKLKRAQLRALLAASAPAGFEERREGGSR